MIGASVSFRDESPLSQLQTTCGLVAKKDFYPSETVASTIAYKSSIRFDGPTYQILVIAIAIGAVGLEQTLTRATRKLGVSLMLNLTEPYFYFCTKKPVG